MALNMDFFEQMEARIPRGEVRTRFAPSPTGYMHVGNLRTALYTYLIARHLGGKFILRIEDTDQERLVEGAVDVIYQTLRQCGLSHDEGPDVGGPVGPYVQTERRELYGRYAELLMEKGGAYRCFCTRERLEELHRDNPTAKYDGRCANRRLTKSWPPGSPMSSARRFRAGASQPFPMQPSARSPFPTTRWTTTC